MSQLGRLLAVVAAGSCLSILASACLYDGGDHSDPYEPAVECTVDADCAHLDDGDSCYDTPRCGGSSCYRPFLQDDTDCQCDWSLHCEALGYEQRACNVLTCDANHQCGEEIAPEGPASATEQDRGDCTTLVCDGTSPDGISEADPSDLPEDDDVCTVDLCTEDGAENASVPDGDYCTDGLPGRCYGGGCYLGCIADDDDACGDEGPGEPQNDDGASATHYQAGAQTCGMLDGDDIDWFKMTLVDEDFETDIIRFEVHASSPTLEVCAYVLCNNFNDPNGGYPGGGCDNKIAGPFGSLGCCWQGAPESLSPTWDLDCTGTTDDAGSMFFSLRAPDGDSCETYVMAALY